MCPLKYLVVKWHADWHFHKKTQVKLKSLCVYVCVGGGGGGRGVGDETTMVNVDGCWSWVMGSTGGLHFLSTFEYIWKFYS